MSIEILLLLCLTVLIGIAEIIIWSLQTKKKKLHFQQLQVKKNLAFLNELSAVLNSKSLSLKTDLDSVVELLARSQFDQVHYIFKPFTKSGQMQILRYFKMKQADAIEILPSSLEKYCLDQVTKSKSKLIIPSVKSGLTQSTFSVTTDESSMASVAALPLFNDNVLMGCIILGSAQPLYDMTADPNLNVYWNICQLLVLKHKKVQSVGSMQILQALAKPWS